MTATVASPNVPSDTLEQFKQTWATPRGIRGLLAEVNNIPIARRYMATGFAFFVLGGLLGLLLRIQLGSPENTFLDAETYNQIFTMHGTTMMFLFVIPFIEALANYMLPLVLGTRDLPFPRMTALSYWTYLFGGIFLYSSFLFGVAPDGGWFAYVPLTNVEHSPGINMDFWDIGLSVAEIAAIGAAAEMIVAILRVRAPGMALNRMPLFAWAMLVTGAMIIFAFTPLIVGTAMLELDRKGLTAFFKPEAGGKPLLWQHIFWVFGHPEVYIMFLPAAGIVSQVVQALARRPIVGYTFMVLSILATGFISFGLWVHHMFTAGLSAVALGFFTAASLSIAIPNGIQVFGWIATLWSGRPVWRTPLLFVLGFLAIFTLGGITGVMVASVPFDWQAHDSYFVVAHFHYVLIGGVVFPLFAGLYYWLPKMTGRLLNERLGRWNFWLMFVFFNIAFFPMHISGLLGMPRRVYTYPAGLGLDTLNLISTIGAFGFAVGVGLLLVNFAWSRKYGERAGDNPWTADTLEWSEESPPPDAQFVTIPVVRSRHPLWEQADLLPQEALLARQMEDLAAQPARWRGALVVTVLDGNPLAIAHMPGPTYAPFTMAVAFLAIFAGVLVEESLLLVLGLAIGTFALFLWFRPQRSETLALEELGDRRNDEERLPLAMAGRIANGWWATLVFIAVLATALITIVASYFYLGDQGSGASESSLAITEAGLLTLLPVAAMGTAAWAVRGVRKRAPGAIRLGLFLTWLLSAAALGLGIYTFPWSTLDPELSAYASGVLGVLGFQWVVLAFSLTALTISLLWAFGKPMDRRGHAVVHNVALIAGFAAASAAVVFSVVYLSPRLW
jgi:cytochrome c oxidase subunit I+III